MRNLRLCLLLVLPVLFAQEPPPAAPAPPSAEEQAKLIAAIREAALAWEGKLGDFTCNRTGRLEARTIRESPAPTPPSAKPPAAKPTSAKSATSKPATAKSADSKASSAPATAKAAPKADAKTSPKTSAAGGSSTVSQAGSGFLLGPWETFQLAEDKVTYSGHTESYSGGAGASTPEAADASGKNPPRPTTAPLLQSASISAFAELLKGIFAESAHTEFTWKGVVGMRGLPVYVLDYKVAKENSTQELVAGSSRATVAYHGTIFADRFTHRVTSAVFMADAPVDFPEQDVQRVFDFGQVVVAGQFNLMPLRCQMQTRASLDMLQSGKAGGKSTQLVARMTTDFLSYRKYAAPVTTPAR